MGLMKDKKSHRSRLFIALALVFAGVLFSAQTASELHELKHSGKYHTHGGHLCAFVMTASDDDELLDAFAPVAMSAPLTLSGKLKLPLSNRVSSAQVSAAFARGPPAL